MRSFDLIAASAPSLFLLIFTFYFFLLLAFPHSSALLSVGLGTARTFVRLLLLVLLLLIGRRS